MSQTPEEQKEQEFKTTHNLPFESAESLIGSRFRIGTCEGLWGSTTDTYYIVAVSNNNPGNGHLNDVFEWFEMSCKRDSKNLMVLQCMNEKFYLHLLAKRGFIPLDAGGENVIKVFNKKLYKSLKKNGNEIIIPGTLKCI